MRPPHKTAPEECEIFGSRRIIKRDGTIVFASAQAGDLAYGYVLQRGGVSLVASCLRGALQLRAISRCLAAVSLLGGATLSRAQVVEPLVPAAIDPVFNRGRNVSVAERTEPSFDALGVRLGSIIALPSIALTTGATNNVYVNDRFKRSDAYYFLQPAIRVTTDLPLHEVSLIASTSLQRYQQETLRNRDAYFVSAGGRLDIGPDSNVTGQVRYSRASESPFASDVAADISVLSEFTNFNPVVTGIYASGRTRVMAKLERLEYRFTEIVFADGTSRDQRERNRTLNRASLQLDYALSPSVSVFVQGNYDGTIYPFARRDGQPNRDSDAYSMLGGVNFDLAGAARGSIAAGYTKRDFNEPIYQDRGGLIVQARVDFFLSPLTTISAGAQRTLQDSASSNNGAYSDSRASVSADHALLRNLIISASALVVENKLLDSGASSQRLLSTLSARYQSNRSASIEGSVQYGMARPGEVPLGVRFNELRGQFTVRFRR